MVGCNWVFLRRTRRNSLDRMQGCVLVVRDGLLAGTFTDGDLRRSLQVQPPPAASLCS